MLTSKITTAWAILRVSGWAGIVEKLRVAYRLPIPQSPYGKWKANTIEEAQWWDGYLGERGLPDRLDPDQPLQPRIASLLTPGQKAVEILDVGAGPLTFLGKRLPGVTVRITAVDPLSDKYDRILKKHAITPLVRTERMDAERLTRRFRRDSFDLVCARNCIDHSYDPERAILQMLPGCYVFMDHEVNEGQRVDYVGLHQWNFSANQEGEFVIGSRRGEVNMSRKYAGICRIECETYDGDNNADWLVTKILKLPRDVEHGKNN